MCFCAYKNSGWGPRHAKRPVQGWKAHRLEDRTRREAGDGDIAIGLQRPGRVRLVVEIDDDD